MAGVAAGEAGLCVLTASHPCIAVELINPRGNLIALAPLLACPLMMLFMGGGIARAVERVSRRAADKQQVPAPSSAGGRQDGW